LNFRQRVRALWFAGAFLESHGGTLRQRLHEMEIDLIAEHDPSESLRSSVSTTAYPSGEVILIG